MCIDEELYGFRGACKFKQYIPSKPRRYGLKYWCLVDVETAVLLEINIYVGKKNKEDKNETGIGEKAVLDLISNYFETDRILTTDNFFTSVGLAKKLWIKNLKLVGTIRANKTEIPEIFLKSKNKEVNSSMFGFNEYLTLVSYVPKKNKSVRLIYIKKKTFFMLCFNLNLFRSFYYQLIIIQKK